MKVDNFVNMNVHAGIVMHPRDAWRQLAKLCVKDAGQMLFYSNNIFPTYFFHLLIFKNIFLTFLSEMPSVSNNLDPDQAQNFDGPDLGPNCLKICYKQTTLESKELHVG